MISVSRWSVLPHARTIGFDCAWSFTMSSPVCGWSSSHRASPGGVWTSMMTVCAAETRTGRKNTSLPHRARPARAMHSGRKPRCIRRGRAG